MPHNKHWRRESHRPIRRAHHPAKGKQSQNPQHTPSGSSPQEQNEHPQGNIMQHVQTGPSPHASPSHTAVNKRPVSGNVVPKAANPKRTHESFSQNIEKSSQGTSGHQRNYRIAGTAIDLTTEEDNKGHRTPRPQPKDYQDGSKGVTEQRVVLQESCESCYEQHVHCPHARRNKHQDGHEDDHMERRLWVDTAAMAIAQGFEEEVDVMKMKRNLEYTINDLQAIWRSLDDRSPYYDARKAVHQMMDENSDDREGVDMVLRKLDDTARELGSA